MKRFLQLMGVVLVATIFHEIYHVITKQTTSIGIQFGEHGGFFTKGYGDSSEIVAYLVTFTVLIVGFIYTFIDLVSRNKKRRKW